ncbi:MAG: ribosome maturation factor RimP [Thermodesulfovibrionia bacterium]|nr:ribosome maturation factor RimP [Thermodesulfovibrionia bacterium]
MNMETMRAKIKEIIEPVIKGLGVALEDMELRKMGRRVFLRVIIDKEGGVVIDDCEQVSREIEAQLDVEDPIPYPYTLEVSSPGLDRPLKTPGDFKRFCGKTVRIVTSAPVENQTFFIGEIIEAGDTEVTLLLSKDKKINIQYKDIVRARLVYDP